MDEDRLPRSLVEYLEVWCADLLSTLTDPQRHLLISTITMMYTGGPYPDRLSIQRLAEIITGGIAPVDRTAETLERFGGADLALANLKDPHFNRSTGIEQLTELLPTERNLAAIQAAYADGRLTDDDNREVMAAIVAALRRPPLPDPIPAPIGLPPLPENYPESWAEHRRKNSHRPSAGRAVCEVRVHTHEPNSDGEGILDVEEHRADYGCHRSEEGR